MSKKKTDLDWFSSSQEPKLLSRYPRSSLQDSSESESDEDNYSHTDSVEKKQEDY